MRLMITFLGVLIILAGIIPLLASLGITLSFLPSESPGYQFIIIAVGIIGLLYGVLNSLLFGFEKFVTIAIGLLTILGGILPFIQNFVPAFLPTTGVAYSLIIIGIGFAGLVYGFVALG